MTIIERGPSKVLTPLLRGEPRSEYIKNDSPIKKDMIKSPDAVLEKPGRRDSDLISTATSALRRLHFRSAGGSRPKRGQPTGSGAQGVPKLMLMGSSTASDTTTNTSTDSSNTVYTMVTVTDAEQEDKSEGQEAFLSNGAKSHKREDRIQTKAVEVETSAREQVRRKTEMRARDILNEFDELFMESEKRIDAEKKLKGKGLVNGVRHHKEETEESGKETFYFETRRNIFLPGMPLLSPMVEAPENGDEKQSNVTDRKRKNERSMSSMVEYNDQLSMVSKQEEQEIWKEDRSASDRGIRPCDTLEVINESPARCESGSSPSTPQMGNVQKDQNFFSKSLTPDEQTLKALDSASSCKSPDLTGKSDRPKSNIRTIHNDLPQRTFMSNVNKRKQSENQDETVEAQSDPNRIPSKLSPKSDLKSAHRDKANDSTSTLFPFPPRNASPKPSSKSPSPKFKKNISSSLKKFTDFPSPFKLSVGTKNEKLEKQEKMVAGEEKTSETVRTEEFKTAKLSPLNQLIQEKCGKVSSKNIQSKFDSLFNIDSVTTSKSSSPIENRNHQKSASGNSKFEFPSCTSPTEMNGEFVKAATAVSGDNSDFCNSDCKRINDQSEHVSDPKTESATIDSHDNHQTGKPNNKRKKQRNDRKSICGDLPIKLAEANEKIVNRKSKAIYYESSGNSMDDKFAGRRNRKYSILTTDGSVKNFVSENSEEFKRNESLNKENINKKKSGSRRASECPQRHRRVSIIQGDSLRHFIFEEPDTSKIKPNKQRKIDTTRNILLEDNVYKRKSSLLSSDTLRNLLGDDGARKAFIGPEDKPRKFSINTLGDIVSARKFSLLPPGEIYTSQIDGKTTEIIKLAPGTKGRPLATIVVQQASIQRGSISGPSGQKEDSLLDVANTFTLEELHEFDMKYGSPHHCRSQSVKTPGRSCGRPNYLCLPQQRSRVASMPNTGVEEEYYRLRHFSITGKGVVNRGDSLKSRRSRSNNSVASSNSSHSTEHLPSNVGTAGSYPGSARTSGDCSLASSRESSTCSAPYKVVMLGSAGVGKSSLISQFMTSEYLHAYDTSLDEEFGEKSVSVLLDNEESELIFVDHPSSEMSPENCITTYQPQAYIIVYSVVDRSSFQIAEETLQSLWKTDSIGSKAVILVGNKTDLVRSRTISSEEGKNMATSYDCKFIETSVGINYNVDELLVGILTQIRLKLQQATKPKRNKSPLGICIGKDGESPKKWRKSRLTGSLKVKGLLGRVWAKDSRSKSCENLHVL